MIPIDDAARIILDSCSPLPPVDVSLLDALGCALAGSLSADADVPPFPRAMMDGFAVIAADTVSSPARLRVVDTLPAGASASTSLRPGTTAKIMTGAPLPPGADAVQKKEVCREHPDGQVEILESVAPGGNVAARGSEFAAGSTLFTAGHVLSPSDLGVLAVFGHARVAVGRKPSLCLFNTGSELVDIEQPIGGGKIRNSNLYSIASFYRANGFPCEPLGIVADEPSAIRTAVREAVPRHDIVLLTGGVSVGDFDLVQAAVAAEGFEIRINAVAIKPGKPMTFACRGDRRLFGLSGNPVSSLVQSARFVLPALRRMAGWAQPAPRFLTAVLAESVRHRGDRPAYRPARLLVEHGRLFCRLLRDQGSADLFAWREADALAILPQEHSQIEAGEPVRVMLLDGFPPGRSSDGR
jgi:molybdopterin molybdotransferase